MKRKPYETAQRAGRDGVRTTLLDTASRLLSADGVGALTMRRIASEVGCSTTVLYTMFGSKDGIADALCREGFERFRRRLAELPPDAGDDPVERVRVLAAAYRGFAVDEPHYYRVMFLQAVPGYRPTGETLAAGDAAFQVLIDAARACVAAGVFRADAPDPHEIAEVWLAIGHGAVSLELTGHLLPETAAARHAAAVDASIAYYLR